MKKILSIAVVLLSLFSAASAQVNNYIFSVSSGSSSFSLASDDADDPAKLKYKTTSFSLGRDCVLFGTTALVELRYTTGTLNSFSEAPTSTPLVTQNTMDSRLNEFSILGMGGWNLFGLRGRLSFPLNFGIVGSYMTSKDIFSGYQFLAAARLRAKFYITNTIGIYAGVHGQLGYGVANVVNSKEREFEYEKLGSRSSAFEVGITIDFHKNE